MATSLRLIHSVSAARVALVSLCLCVASVAWARITPEFLTPNVSTLVAIKDLGYRLQTEANVHAIKDVFAPDARLILNRTVYDVNAVMETLNAAFARGFAIKGIEYHELLANYGKVALQIDMTYSCHNSPPRRLSLTMLVTMQDGLFREVLLPGNVSLPQVCLARS